MDEQEKVTMSKRIQAFYEQSGGPNNPKINQIIEKHLLYGKDHGTPGQRETLKDAFLEVFLDDHSTKGIIMWLLRQKFETQDRWNEFINKGDPGLQRIAEEFARMNNSHLEELEKRLNGLEKNIEKPYNSYMKYKENF